MKNMKINLFALALVIGGTFVTSCNEDDATGDSVLEVNSGVTGSVVTDFNSSAALTVNEVDEETFTYMVSISEAHPVDIHLTVSQISGSATPDEDFTFDSVVVIPAYATTASGSISILNDLTPESLESFTLQIGGVNTSNATIPVKTVTFNIVNELSNDLELAFNFNKPFSIAGSSYTLCGIGYDMDFYVFDADFNDTGIYDAATSSCTESLTLSSGILPDGVYTIYYDIYDDGGISGVYHDPFDIPVTVDYLRGGGISEGTFTQEDSFIANSTDGSGFDYVMTVELSAGVFTIKDSADTTIASGKSSNKSKVEAAIKAAREKRH